MAPALIDLREVDTFMESVLPSTMPVRHRRTTLLRFYSWLYREGTRRFGLAFFCPHCEKRAGECVCPQLGHKWPGPGRRDDWVYEIDILAIVQWRLEVRSATRIDPAQLNRSVAAERQLAELIIFLKQL